jgi:hypothetical protein
VNYVSLEKLNSLRFPSDPVAMPKLWRWCREGKLPARKIGGEWFVDLDAFDRGEKGEKKQEVSGPARLVLDRLRVMP